MASVKIAAVLLFSTSVFVSGCDKGGGSSANDNKNDQSKADAQTTTPAVDLTAATSPTTPFFNPHPAAAAGGTTINVADFIIPNQAYSMLTAAGQINGPFGFGTSTNYANGKQFYTVQANSTPSFYLNWEKTATDIVARMDTTQQPYPYSYKNGIVLPLKAVLNHDYVNTAVITHYEPGTCKKHGAPANYTWTRTVINHFTETLGQLGQQEMIRVRYRHSTPTCKVYDEMMDYARGVGHVRWTAVCNGNPVEIWQVYGLTANPVSASLANDCAT